MPVTLGCFTWLSGRVKYFNVGVFLDWILTHKHHTRTQSWREDYQFIIYLLKANSPVNHTGSPQGFSQVQISHKLIIIKASTSPINHWSPQGFSQTEILHKLNTIQNVHINLKHLNIIRQLVPLVLLSTTKKDK